MNISYQGRILATAIVVTLVFVMLAAALWFPKVQRQVSVMDALFVLDITESMNVKDVDVDGTKVSRLDWAKVYTRKALLELPCGAHAGLSIFSESRSLILMNPVEVCSNYHDLAQMLDQIEGPMAWARSSEVSKAAFTAIKQAKAMKTKPAIVFLTDGHEAPPLNATLYPKFKGKPGDIKGVFVGIGGEALLPIPKRDETGQINGVWQPNEVLQQDVYISSRGDLDEAKSHKPKTEHLSSQKKDHLAELASMVGFHYLESPQDADELIDELETVADTHDQVINDDFSAWFALSALLLLILLFLPYRQILRFES